MGRGAILRYALVRSEMKKLADGNRLRNSVSDPVYTPDLDIGQHLAVQLNKASATVCSPAIRPVANRLLTASGQNGDLSRRFECTGCRMMTAAGLRLPPRRELILI